jgi:hypothetical protein
MGEGRSHQGSASHEWRPYEVTNDLPSSLRESTYNQILPTCEREGSTEAKDHE